MLSKKAVEEYQQICREEQGRELSYEEAQDEALRLLQMFKVIYRPIPKEVLKKYEQQKWNARKFREDETLPKIWILLCAKVSTRRIGRPAIQLRLGVRLPLHYAP